VSQQDFGDIQYTAEPWRDWLCRGQLRVKKSHHLSENGCTHPGSSVSAQQKKADRR